MNIPTNLSRLFGKFNNMLDSLKLDTTPTSKSALNDPISAFGGLNNAAAAPPVPAVDQYTPSDNDNDADPDKTDAATDLQSSAGGMKISMHFNLFYSLSQRISAEMGTKGTEKFQRVTSKVTEAFKADFSLSIDGVGKYLGATDKSLNLDPQVTNDFLDSIDGMADMSASSLNNFLDQADAFFGELEAKYGDLGGAFDDMRDLVKAQAQDFFAGVQQIQQDMGMGGDAAPAVGGAASPALGQIADLLRAGAGDGRDLSGETDADGQNANAQLVPLAGATGGRVARADYQQFLEMFQQYTQRLSFHFSQRLVSDIPGYSGVTGPDKNLINAAANDAKPAIATIASADPSDSKGPVTLMDLTA